MNRYTSCFIPVAETSLPDSCYEAVSSRFLLWFVEMSWCCAQTKGQLIGLTHRCIHSAASNRRCAPYIGSGQRPLYLNPCSLSALNMGAGRVTLDK